MKKIKKFIHIVFEKYGVIKLFGSAIIASLFIWLYSVTTIETFKWVAIVFGVYVGIVFIITFIYAWVINPIKSLRKNKEKK